MKKYAHNIFQQISEMRAFQSQYQKTGFFTDPFGTFDFWTFLKMSKNRFPPSNPENYFSSIILVQ